MYTLGAQSRQRLGEVHADLHRVVMVAIELTEADFSVHEGMRTEEQQRLYVARGASMTMDSRHLTGHAVDLVPYIDGQLRWDWPLCIKIAEAMREAAIQEAVSIVWGGVWDTLLSDLNGDLQNAMTDYSLRVRASGRQKTFFDGPHYELHRGTYR